MSNEKERCPTTRELIPCSHDREAKLTAARGAAPLAEIPPSPLSGYEQKQSHLFQEEMRDDLFSAPVVQVRMVVGHEYVGQGVPS